MNNSIRMGKFTKQQSGHVFICLVWGWLATCDSFWLECCGSQNVAEAVKCPVNEDEGKVRNGPECSGMAATASISIIMLIY